MIDRAAVKPFFRSLVMVGLVASLAACSSSDNGPKIPGKRISVLSVGPKLTPDPAVADQPVKVSPAFRNTGWPEAGGVPSHAMYNLYAPSAPKLVGTIDIGAGATDEKPLVAMPIFTLDTVFAKDTDGIVRAIDLASGSVKWKVDLTPKGAGANVGFLGGLAYADGKIFAVTGYGDVIALDAATGKEIWRKSIGIPFRSAPTVDSGRVFAITQNNQLYALSTDKGAVLWTYVGLQESAAYLGSASPAVAGEVVVAPFSSGELVALRVENGRSIWQNSMTPTGSDGGVASINDIRGQVVLDRGGVFAASAGGFVTDIDLRTGERSWERNFGSGNTPWIGGDVMFVQSDSGDLLALDRDKGLIHWVSALPKYEDPEHKDGAINWFGPVLAGGRLFLAGTNSKLLIVAPGAGKILGSVALPGPAAGAPIVSNGVIYVVLSSGRLAVLR